MFLNCPAYLDAERTDTRCGLPAEITCQFTMQSSDGPLDSAMIRCPAGHWFNAPIECFTWDSTGNRNQATATATAASARHAGPTGTHGRAGTSGPVLCDPAKPGQQTRRPNTAPAYYLGRPASTWITAMRPRRSSTAASHLDLSRA